VERVIVSSLEHPQSIRAVFFDVGDTLLAPHPSRMDIVLGVCAARGMPVERATLEAHVPSAQTILLHHTREHPDIWANEREIDALWLRYYTALLRPCLPDTSEAELTALAAAITQAFTEGPSYALYPDVLPILSVLQQRGLTLGVISDWGPDLALVLRHHDLVRYFDFAVVSAVVRHAKPDPALFATALQRADAIPDYALHIGDSYVLDVLGARAAGITPILLDRAARHDPAALDCLVVRDLYDLLVMLEIPLP
jgi:putative hydrolase of the HAD superfamily